MGKHLEKEVTLDEAECPEKKAAKLWTGLDLSRGLQEFNPTQFTYIFRLSHVSPF